MNFADTQTQHWGQHIRISARLISMPTVDYWETL